MARRIKNETGPGGSAPGVQRDVARLILHAQGSQWAEILFKQFRAIATRYDKTARNFLAAIHLAASVILLN